MKTVWKAVLTPVEKKASLFIVKMPANAKIIMVGPDPANQECVWFEFERKNGDNLFERYLEIFGTGDLIPPLSEHVLSFRAGEFIWHLYDHGAVVKPLGMPLG